MESEAEVSGHDCERKLELKCWLPRGIGMEEKNSRLNFCAISEF